LQLFASKGGGADPVKFKGERDKPAVTSPGSGLENKPSITWQGRGSSWGRQPPNSLFEVKGGGGRKGGEGHKRRKFDLFFHLTWGVHPTQKA